MTDKQYLIKMIALTEELERAASAEPYDEDVYNDVIARLTASHLTWYHNRRQRPWLMYFSILCLLWILCWLVYEICCVLFS